ncbi:MAG: methylated-DNA--[protein]-cysteine S-methyltransferase [Gammaproteobacteria bacterium]
MIDHPDYQRIARSIAWVGEHFREQPGVAQMAAAAGLGTRHYARLFRRWAGVTPSRYLRALSLAAAKTSLDAGAGVLAASLGAGLSGPGRLHDLFVDFEAVTPGDYRARGEGLAIRWGVADSPFGACVAGLTPRGLCFLGFCDDAAAPGTALARRWPRAHLERDDDSAAAAIDAAFGGHALQLSPRGTNFQVRVWRALLDLPPGETATYGQLARRIGRQGAARAVGRAVGDNPVAVLIPCHRVLRGDGSLGGYRWGTERKLAVLTWENLRRL